MDGRFGVDERFGVEGRLGADWGSPRRVDGRFIVGILGHQSVDVCDFSISRCLLQLMAPEVAVLALLGFCLLFPTFVGQVSPPNVAAVLAPDLVAVIGSNKQAPWTVFCSAERSLRRIRRTHRTGHCRRRKFSNPGLAVPFQAVHMKQVGAGCPGYLST